MADGAVIPSGLKRLLLRRPAQAVAYTRPFRCIGRRFDRDPIETLRVQPVQRLVERRCIRYGIGRHVLSDPQVDAAALCRWLPDEQERLRTVMARVQPG